MIEKGTRVRIADGYFPEGSVFHQPPMTGTVRAVEGGCVFVDWDEHPHGDKVGQSGKPIGMGCLARGYVTKLEDEAREDPPQA